MIKSFYKGFLLFILYTGIFLQATGQQIQYNLSDSLTSIPISLIPDYQVDARDAFFKANKFLVSVSKTSSVHNATLKKLINDTKIKVNIFDSIGVDKLSASNIDMWDRKWSKVEDEIKSIYEIININTVLFEKEYNRMNYVYQLWLQTGIDIKTSTVPDEIRNSVISVKEEARRIRNRLKDEQRVYLSLKQECISLLNTVVFKRKLLVDARKNIVANLLVAEQPVLWKSFAKRDNDINQEKKSIVINQFLTSITSYAKTDYTILFIIISIFVLFTFLVFYFKKILKKEIGEDKIHEQEGVINLVLKRPFVISLLLTWLVISIALYIPSEIRSIIMLIMMIPVIILIRQFMGLKDVVTISLFVIYYLFTATRSIIFSNTIFIRILYLFIALLSLFIVWHLIKSNKYSKRFEKFGWFVKLVFYIEFLMFLTVVFFFIAGNITIASMILSGAIMFVLVGIFFYSINKLIFSIVEYLFENKFFHKSHIVQNHSKEIQNGIKKILSIILFIYWVLFSLGGFGIKREVISGVKEIFMHQYAFGGVSFGLNNIVSFVIAIYFSIWLSRFLLIFLKEEVFVRRKTDKGVSSTITLLLRYSIMTLGFFVALAAAGIQMDNISIVIGALGVGIGFGLQDIFNNLVSGIVLAVERPIKEDDIIQVGELTGTVKEIGFRSSKIKAFDGSEVVVPNGHIVSNQMINWTLSDRRRRLKIDLGVSYDSNPEEVLEILKEVSENHTYVEKDPAPLARFVGFGDSSLDFQLLFWIPDYARGFGVGTEVALDLFKKLKEKGIEIPYPKQDITITREIEKEVKKVNSKEK